MDKVVVSGQRAGKATMAVMERAMARHQEKNGKIQLVQDRSWADPKVPQLYKESLRLLAADMGKGFHLNVDYSKLKMKYSAIVIGNMCANWDAHMRRGMA